MKLLQLSRLKTALYNSVAYYIYKTLPSLHFLCFYFLFINMVLLPIITPLLLFRDIEVIHQPPGVVYFIKYG